MALPAARSWMVILMTSDSDLIRRQDALAEIRREMKRVCTAARRLGYKESLEIIRKIPSQATPSPIVHSHWFIASQWWLCSNCGGRSSDSRTTPYCPWCGARMDELMDQDIE